MPEAARPPPLGERPPQGSDTDHKPPVIPQKPGPT